MNLKLLAIVTTAILVSSVTVGTLANASPRTSPKAKAAPIPRCNVYVTAPWTRGPTPTLRIEAYSDGPTCAKAVITYVVRTRDGRPVHNEAYVGEFMALTEAVTTRQQMLAALTDWIIGGTRRTDNSDLPDWKAGASEPEAREFGFTPDEGVTRAAYLAARASRIPMLCYVQGLESLRCLIWRNDTLESLGVQQFPG
jgi:hypothetical protein